MVRSPFDPEAVAAYLARVHGRPARDVRVTPMGGGRQGDKGYGYGIPLRVDYELDGGRRRAGIEWGRAGAPPRGVVGGRAPPPPAEDPGPPGARLWVGPHGAPPRLPRHVPSLD